MVSVAVVCINGLLGRPVIQGLLTEPFISKIRRPIRLVTSNPDKKPIESDLVQYINYTESSLTEAFKGADVVICLGNVMHAPLQAILDAVVENKVRLYIPSQFGVDIDAANKVLPGFFRQLDTHSESARERGIKTVDIITAFFYDDNVFTRSELPLTQVNEDNSVQIIGDEDTKVNPSYFRDIGVSVAALATSEDFSALPDKIRIFSDKITMGELLDKYEKKHSVKLKKTYKDASTFVKEVSEDFIQNGIQFARFGDYLKALMVAGEGNGVIFEEDNQRELVNPNESLFKWTKFNRD